MEEAHIFRIEEFGELEVLNASFNRYSFAAHWHSELVIAVTEAGRANFRYRGASHRAGRDAVFVHHPGEPHSGGPEGPHGWRYRCIYVPENLFKRITGASHLPFFGDDVFDDPALAALFRRFFEGLQSDGSRLLRESHLIQALTALMWHHGERRPPSAGHHEPASVRQAREFLHGHLSEDIGAAALSRAAGVSPYHLIRLFHRELGLTPHAYQLSIRIAQAKILLRRNTPVADVALQTGFYDQPHFTKVFKSQVGLTPHKYASAGFLSY